MIHRRKVGMAGSLAIAVGLLLVGPTAAADDHGLHLTLPSWDFTSGDCLAFDESGSCSLAAVTADGTVDGNLAGPGTYHGDLMVGSSPGGTCNIVDERDTFAFATGRLFVHSFHEDCRVHGNRIFTKFSITGGTGDFLGATGSGLEFGNGGAPITYNGQIKY